MEGHSSLLGWVDFRHLQSASYILICEYMGEHHSSLQGWVDFMRHQPASLFPSCDLCSRYAIKKGHSGDLDYSPDIKCYFANMVKNYYDPGLVP